MKPNHSLEVTKFETKHFPLESQLIYLAQNFPKIFPYPFSGIIALQVGNRPIIQACHHPNQPAFTADQLFNVLSIGKLFTAIAVMQLIEDRVQLEEEKISLKSSLNKLLTIDELDLPLRSPYLERKPETDALEKLKKCADEITLKHLLSHTAGFLRSLDGKDKATLIQREDWDRNKIGKYHYSNYGYQLLARIIGKHSNCNSTLDHEMSFRAYIEKRIFERAGMNGAVREIHFTTKNKLDCFEITKDGKPPGPVVKPEPYPHGNGCWYMQAGDLLAFACAIRHHVLINEDSFQTMKDQDLGFWIDRDQKTGKINIYGHPGGSSGMFSFLNILHSDPPITVVLLSNYSGCESMHFWLNQFLKELIL